MTGARLPAVRIPPVIPGQGGDEDVGTQDAVLVDLPPSNKFGFAWPTEQHSTVPIPLASDRPVSLSSSEGETDISEEELNAPVRRTARSEDFGEDSDFTTPTNHLNSEQDPLDNVGRIPSLPRLSRAFSMPLPSQLGSLQHPRRPSTSYSPVSPATIEPSTELEHFRELSLELADSVQMVIQTLLQLSPPQVLDPAKEQFSACSLSIPTPSISAMFTSMKNLNYMSANMSALSGEFASNLGSSSSTPTMSNVQNDFDVGEMLQSVGDALSGVAAQAGVDLVLFHGDVGMKHISVKGNESGLSYTLSHVIRQVIGTAQPGDTVEVGLYIETVVEEETARDHGSFPGQSSPTPSEDTALRCTFYIRHQFTGGPSASAPDLRVEGSTPDSFFNRPHPAFDTLILRRLLRHIGASLKDNPRLKDTSSSRTHELVVVLGPGEPSAVNPTITVSSEDMAVLGYPDMQIANEPSLQELLLFAESLRGKSVTLHASTKGSFAHHLSSFLTAWGMDVSHVSTEPDAGGEYEALGDVSETTASSIPVMDMSTPPIVESVASTSPTTRRKATDSAFILIDDDVSVLRARLQKIKTELVYPLNLQGRKRPSLASHHRPRSSPQVARVMGLSSSSNALMHPSVVIVHFTSLANFKLVKDVIQTILSPLHGHSSRIPEVIVIPKPAGPRRFLTALHTAVTRPVVDPFFVPTATSPMSPGLHSNSPFFSFAGAPRSPGGRSNASFRTNSDKSTKSPRDQAADGPVAYAPPSPLGQSDNMEYFSDAAVKLGTSPATGLLIQSPDGQPTGIFFHPKPRIGPAPPSPNMERDRNQDGRDTPVRQRAYPRAQSGSDDRYSPRSSGFALSPPAVRSNPRTLNTSLDATTEVVAISSKGKARQSATSPVEEKPSSSIEQNSATLESMSSDSTAQPPGGPRYLARRQSQQQTNQTPSSPASPPSSPKVGSVGRSGSTRRLPKRPTVESHMSAPAAVSKKSKLGPDSNIVPPISVLIVDDNPINQTILSTFMKKKKIKYDVAKNGEEAVHKWRSGVYHLILMDIQMPVMDGIQATKEIRRIEKQSGAGGFPSTPQSEGQRTPSEASTTSESRTISTPPYRSSVIIVALTASSLQADRVAALAAGCNDFLTKPVSLEWLNSKIIEWGSIKALQMWADIRPEVVKSISTGQNAQAQQVARRLHVPEGRSATPSGERTRGTSMAGRRPSSDIINANIAERANAHGTDGSLSGADPAKGSSSALNHLSSAFTSMTASEAALGLAAAHRPQAPADGVRIPADVIQAAVIRPPPEVAATVPELTPPAPAPKPAPQDSPVTSADEGSAIPRPGPQ